MSDTDNNTQTTTTTTQDESTLPQWARDAISSANAEAAKYRVQAKQAAEDARAKANQDWETKFKTVADEKSETAKERDAMALDLVKMRVAVSSDVPRDQLSDFVDLLQGSTEEEFKASAAKILQFGGSGGTKATKPVDRSQGLTGGSNTDSWEAEFARLLSGNLS
jgi:membrane protein involved in colicin uptake